MHELKTFWMLYSVQEFSIHGSPRADLIEIFRGLASVLILNVIFASLCNERSIKETLTNTCKYYY